MIQFDRVTDLPTEDLSRYLADAALELASAQTSSTPLWDELSTRLDIVEIP